MGDKSKSPHIYCIQAIDLFTSFIAILPFYDEYHLYIIKFQWYVCVHNAFFYQKCQKIS